MLIINRFRLGGGKTILSVIASLVAFFLLLVVNNAYAIFILSSYGGQFSPPMELITGVFIHTSITEIMILVALVFVLIILGYLQPFFGTPDDVDFAKSLLP